MTESTDKSSNDKSAKSGCLPSGSTFLLYCAGIALLFLVVYIMSSGLGFKFNAGGSGVSLESVQTPLNREGVPTDPETRTEKSRELEQKFEDVTESSSQEPSSTEQEGPFNGEWTASGSIYQLEQQGSEVALLELTNGIVTSMAAGTGQGNRATLTVYNVTGMTFPAELEFLSDGRIKMSVTGTTMFLEPN